MGHPALRVNLQWSRRFQIGAAEPRKEACYVRELFS